jgi:hypothetical protein
VAINEQHPRGRAARSHSAKAPTLQQIKDISTWLLHHPKFLEDGNLRRKIKPGYRVLFYGPSG